MPTTFSSRAPLRIHVTDLDTKVGIGKAWIAPSNDERGVPRPAAPVLVADGSGFINLVDLPPNSQFTDARIGADGYAPQFVDLDTKDDDSEVVLARAHATSVRCLWGDGRPVRGVMVGLSQSAPPQSQVTATDGNQLHELDAAGRGTADVRTRFVDDMGVAKFDDLTPGRYNGWIAPSSRATPSTFVVDCPTEVVTVTMVPLMVVAAWFDSNDLVDVHFDETDAYEEVFWGESLAREPLAARWPSAHIRVFAPRGRQNPSVTPAPVPIVAHTWAGRQLVGTTTPVPLAGFTAPWTVSLQDTGVVSGIVRFAVQDPNGSDVDDYEATVLAGKTRAVSRVRSGRPEVLKPGTYILRSGPFGTDFPEERFTVVAGATTRVTVHLRQFIRKIEVVPVTERDDPIGSGGLEYTSFVDDKERSVSMLGLPPFAFWGPVGVPIRLRLSATGFASAEQEIMLERAHEQHAVRMRLAARR